MGPEWNASLKRRILALRAKTTANGCTREEAEAAAVLAARLEERLGRQVQAQASHASPSILTRIWRGHAQAYETEQERRRAEAMSHIVGLKR
jgi:hypothetical protein